MASVWLILSNRHTRSHSIIDYHYALRNIGNVNAMEIVTSSLALRHSDMGHISTEFFTSFASFGFDISKVDMGTNLFHMAPVSPNVASYILRTMEPTGIGGTIRIIALCLDLLILF